MPPLDPPFRLHARPGKAAFCTERHAPEVHPAPLSVATGGSSSSQPTPKKMEASGGPAELSSGGLAGRVHGPSNTLKFRGPACGAHPRTLRFHVPCLPCDVHRTSTRSGTKPGSSRTCQCVPLHVWAYRGLPGIFLKSIKNLTSPGTFGPPRNQPTTSRSVAFLLRAPLVQCQTEC
jgi:hypothetical protein